MIPKTIHYLWLSDEKPDNVIACLDSWKQHLKGYEIIEWNKSNFPYNDFIWTREAFSVQKWAFVTDFFRLWVLKKQGGIYLDADITVRSNFDNFLNHKLFIGTELSERFGPHVIGAEQGHPFITQCLNYYENRHFIINGKNEELLIPLIMTKIFIKEYKYGGKIVFYDNKPLQIGDMTIYNDTYFTINVYNECNVCYHNCFNSWKENKYFFGKSVETYCSRKFFIYDMFHKEGISKYIIPLLPCFVIAFYYNWQMKIKNNKRIKRVKIDAS